MAADPVKPEHTGDIAARYFLVELRSGADPEYAVCERVATFSPGRDGIPAGIVEHQLATWTMRATPLMANGGGGGAELARLLVPLIVYSGQTGRGRLASGGLGGTGADVNFNVNFQNNPPK